MILADHCVYATTINLLRDRGYPTTRLRDLAATNSTDKVVAEIATRHDLVLLTNDKGFANIQAYPPAAHQGIILLRISAEDESQVHGVLLQLLQEQPRETLRHRLVVVDKHKYRIRAGDPSTELR